ncbi:MAG: mannose-1-phosphate guanylyltransferase [Bacillus sp. (in: Bacteria)]|nr:mannose-1-phosphate guanylyltransferase [Bacillus sp. (in: firmicutes)]MCM1427253.1 mannose-1-phosphate guanylyltransferase [Eubacterium sp.]
MKTYGVIMAGGGGTRFWPLSRQELPKQLLNLTGKDLMVNETIDRLEGNVEKEDIFIVTNVAQAELMLEATSGRISAGHILAEPAARNTAACIGYAAMEILQKYGDGIMCILPSDHYIKKTDVYKKVIADAIQTAKETDALVTIGIQPTFPSTGYGYIRHEEEKSQDGYYRVKSFVEKPNLKKAKEYLLSGEYLWNSGMFIWKASVIMRYFEGLLPDVYGCLQKIGKALNTSKEQEVIQEVYPQIPKISIDYGIMERADKVLVLEGDFGWSDVGSWDALEALYDKDEYGNITYGEQVHIDTHDCIIYAKDKLVTTIGLDSVIVVETEDAVLVCDKNRAQEVKKIVEALQDCDKRQYL